MSSLPPPTRSATDPPDMELGPGSFDHMPGLTRLPLIEFVSALPPAARQPWLGRPGEHEL